MYEFKATPNEYYIDFSIIENDEDLVAKGYVKWDGCSNWDISPENVMIHFCSGTDIKEFGQILESCYEYAKEHFDNDMFD